MHGFHRYDSLDRDIRTVCAGPCQGLEFYSTRYGERFIRTWKPIGGKARRVWLAFSLLFALILTASCGGGEDTTQTTPDTNAAATTTAAVAETTVGSGQEETIRDIPFRLNTKQPVPPDFRAAYQRKALIAVQFYKSGEDPFYPQGLSVDEDVNNAVDKLNADYPTVEFFSYEITNPGDIANGSPGTGDKTQPDSTSGDPQNTDTPSLAAGEYGTLPAQLGVGFTPFFATLAPQGDDYIIENLFQGYVTQPVVNQALFDLSAASDVTGNTSDVNVVLDQFELTDDGSGGLQYVSIQNNSGNSVDLQGFTLRVLDPETGEVNPGSGEVSINEKVEIPAKRSRSIGRDAKVVDADGKKVAGVFETGQDDFKLSPGDQLALVDSGGAIADTITI